MHRSYSPRYQDLIPVSIPYTTIISDIYYSTLNLQKNQLCLHQRKIPLGANIANSFIIPTHLPSIIIASFKNLIDAFHQHKPFPNQLNLSTLPLTFILARDNHLIPQLFHYRDCQNSYTDSKQESNESFSEKDPLETTGYVTYNSKW